MNLGPAQINPTKMSKIEVSLEASREAHQAPCSSCLSSSVSLSRFVVEGRENIRWTPDRFKGPGQKKFDGVKLSGEEAVFAELQHINRAERAPLATRGRAVVNRAPRWRGWDRACPIPTPSRQCGARPYRASVPGAGGLTPAARSAATPLQLCGEGDEQICGREKRELTVSAHEGGEGIGWGS